MLYKNCLIVQCVHYMTITKISNVPIKNNIFFYIKGLTISYERFMSIPVKLMQDFLIVKRFRNMNDLMK